MSCEREGNPGFTDFEQLLLDDDAQRVVWETVKCPTCHAPPGLACEDKDGYRRPNQTHDARIQYFYDFTEYRGQ